MMEGSANGHHRPITATGIFEVHCCLRLHATITMHKEILVNIPPRQLLMERLILPSLVINLNHVQMDLAMQVQGTKKGVQIRVIPDEVGEALMDDNSQSHGGKLKESR